MVRHVLQDAIEYIHLYLMIHHSFPRSGAAVEGTRAALVKASRSRLPGAAGILNRILYDEEYFLNMSVIVSITSRRVVASLTFLIAACSNPNYSKWHQGALRPYGCG
jgi:hypothetical protein